MTHYVQLRNGQRKLITSYIANVLALAGRIRYVLRTESVEILELLGPRAELRAWREGGL